METFLIIFSLLVLLLGIFEYKIHHKYLKNIPIRIHVNGSRGKSSVVRLIAAGLRAGNIKVFGKTTGTSPRIIDENGEDKYIHRLRSASIGEQISLIRYFSKLNPEALVIECMAVNPQYQWISEQKIVKSTIGVMTNVRPDHLDEMGITMNQITNSMSNTIPFGGIMVSSENKKNNILKNIAEERNTKFYKVNNEIDDSKLKNFRYLEHKENVSLALKVCELCGIDYDVALKGMEICKPDPGALTIWSLKYKKNSFKFINAFAANDPASTLKTWKMINKRMNSNNFTIFLNTREDRQYRTIQLINLIFKELKPNIVVLRGKNFPKELDDLMAENRKIVVHKFPYSIKQKKLIKFMAENLNESVVLGIGNIVGWGEELMKNMKEYKID
tara:strand:+ start:484 stop:1644 length:1161 start_codon:yes stop_codon:yes gene_type:complete